MTNTLYPCWLTKQNNFVIYHRIRAYSAFPFLKCERWLKINNCNIGGRWNVHIQLSILLQSVASFYKTDQSCFNADIFVNISKAKANKKTYKLYLRHWFPKSAQLLLAKDASWHFETMFIRTALIAEPINYGSAPRMIWIDLPSVPSKR